MKSRSVQRTGQQVKVGAIIQTVDGELHTLSVAGTLVRGPPADSVSLITRDSRIVAGRCPALQGRRNVVAEAALPGVMGRPWYLGNRALTATGDVSLVRPWILA